MNDMDDKLVEMALKSGAVNHFVQGLPDRYAFSLSELTSFRAAIIADLCGDVEPVAWRFRWSPQGDWHITSHEPRGGDGTNKEPLYSATTLAAAQALNAELVARVEGLEKDAARYRHLRGHRGMEHDSFAVHSTLTDDLLWGDDLDHEIDRIAAIAARSGT